MSKSKICVIMQTLIVLIGVVSQQIFPTQSSVPCYDLEECRNSEVSGETMQCFGELSCADSNFTNGCCGPSRERVCLGDFACANSVWYNASWFGAYSSFSIVNLTIYNSGVTMQGWVFGYYSGYGATIYCYDSSDCTIACDGNACVNLNFTCDSSSNCNTLGDQSYNDDGNQPEYYRGLRVIAPVSETSLNTEGGRRLCDTSSGGNCDYTTISVLESNYSVLCNGYRACLYSIIELTSNTSNSGIYCSAFDACRNSNLIAKQGSRNTTLYCGSYLSCSETIVSGFEKIYVLGNPALNNSVIYSDNNAVNEMNLYLGAVFVSKELTIYCNYSDTCSVFCDAYEACANIVIHCFGSCNVECSGVGPCPLVVDYTVQPTKYPTGWPSIYTTGQQMTTMSSVGGTTAETSAANGKLQDDGALVSQLQTWEIGGYSCVCFSLVAPIVISVIACWYHKQDQFQGCDQPNYFAIFISFWHFGDFYSDLMFTFILLTTENHLWPYAVFFSIVPHFLSNFISLYNIRKWQNYSIYISKYVYHYDWLIIFVSVVAGFYCSIELARSKMFYINMFSMQLKHSDYLKIQNFRFFNTVVLEFS